MSQVFIENQGSSNKSVDVGSIMGKGGAGELTSEVPDEMAAKAWRFTRLNQYNKDVPKSANGGLVLGPVSNDVGQWQHIQISTNQQAEQSIGGPKDIKVYGHGIVRGTKRMTVEPGEPDVSWLPKMQEEDHGSSFTAVNMGQWQNSHEVPVEKGSECKGLLRPAFEMVLDSSRTLSPSPALDANAMCLFAAKKFIVKAKSLVAL